eukprot:COSAG01_NODE_2109_length_8408_cov_33.352870_4_plen_41_part_00
MVAILQKVPVHAALTMSSVSGAVGGAQAIQNKIHEVPMHA